MARLKSFLPKESRFKELSLEEQDAPALLYLARFLSALHPKKESLSRLPPSQLPPSQLESAIYP